jgi:hypothetical protein
MKSSNPNITLEFTPESSLLVSLSGAKRCPLYAGILRNNSYEIFSFFCKTNPIFPSFLPKNNDSTKKQTQFKANSKPNKPNNESKIRVAKPIQTQTNPIYSKAETKAFARKACAQGACAIGSDYMMIYSDLLAKLNTLKGAGLTLIYLTDILSSHNIKRKNVKIDKGIIP